MDEPHAARKLAAHAAKVAPLDPGPSPVSPPRDAPLARRRRRRTLQRGVLYGGVALAVVAGGVFAARTIAFYAHHAQTDDAQIEGHIDPVLPRVAGYVSEVLVHDNEPIQANQVVVRIDPTDFQARVTQAQAALTRAQVAVAVAQANVATAETMRDKTGRDLVRAEALRQKGVVSPQDYDAAKAAADAATTTHDAAVSQVAAARAEVAQRQADLDYAQLQLSYATLTAPSAGVVSKKSVEIGQFVQAGQPLLAVVADHDTWVVANFKETQISRMHVGQPATVEVDAYPDVVFHARVDSIAAATGAKFSLLPPDNATGNFVKVVQRIPVKLIFIDPPDPVHPLRVGMNVTATVDLG